MTFRRLYRVGALLAALSLQVSAAGRWEMQYLHDENRSSLSLNDIQFASVRRGVAVGAIHEGKRTRPVTLVTADGGLHWTQQPAEEEGIRLFFLNENIGWMATAKGLWSTTEAGRNWRKLPNSPKDLLNVHFLSEQHGYAVGWHRSAWKTTDGGRTWKAIAEPASKKDIHEQAAFTCITFLNPTAGFISGWTSRRYTFESQRLPDWIEPSLAIVRAERPVTWLSLVTENGGADWKPSRRSNYGRLTRIVSAPGARSLMLVELGDGFGHPSVLIRADYKKNSFERVFAQKDVFVTGMAISPSGRACAVGSQPAGGLRTAPVPAKVRIHCSDGPEYTLWAPMEADYRAVANRVSIAVVDDQHMWVATDTGMILRLVP